MLQNLTILQGKYLPTRLVAPFIVLALAGFLGYVASPLLLALLVVGIGGMVLLKWPFLGLPLAAAAALIIPLEIGTGTAVVLNSVSLIVPAMLGIWVLDMVRQKRLHLAPSRTNRPLFLFLCAGLLSMAIGIVFWDPMVPRSSSFLLVQLAQWALFLFSAGAFWLAGNLIHNLIWLKRLVFFFLIVAGTIAILFVLPRVGVLISPLLTFTLIRAPFWMLLAALATGQLLFNQKLTTAWRLFLILILGAVLTFSFYWNREGASSWVATLATIGVLAWFRWPRLRWPVVLLLLILASTGILSSAIYDFAGGDEEWVESGGSRLTLIGRVIEVTMRNPVTGLGPAAYRPYAGMKPLLYEKALWVEPQISSHNNYVDLFSHTGLLGLAIFFWFAAELTGLGLRLRSYFTEGFAAGYVNSMLAVWAGSLILMLFADWILPYVYNIGFPGFQASVLIWLFLGGLVTLEQIQNRQMVK